MAISSFTQLDVYRKARHVTRLVYDLTEQFPRSQQFTLTPQMQRAALSIGSNIAEGFGRRTPKDKAHFYTVSKGSAEELQHFLLVAKDRAYLKGDEELWQLLEDVGAMLRRLIQRTLEWR
jgi:four helix bundle protein